MKVFLYILYFIFVISFSWVILIVNSGEQMILNWSVRDLVVGFSQVILSLLSWKKAWVYWISCRFLALWFCHFKTFLLRRLLGNGFLFVFLVNNFEGNLAVLFSDSGCEPRAQE